MDGRSVTSRGLMIAPGATSCKTWQTCPTSATELSMDPTPRHAFSSRDAGATCECVLTQGASLHRLVRHRALRGVIVGVEPTSMHNEFTAVFERDGEWYIAYSPEIPGANGQGRNKEEARESLAHAIALILADRRENGLRGVPPDAERGTVIVK